MTIIRDLYLLVASLCVLALSYVTVQARIDAFDAHTEARYMRAETESVYRTVGKHVSTAYRCVERY